jgi:hypothetical protein
MPTISLHIGLPHSGSTTIRHLLGQNRQTLRDAGVHVPSSWGRRSHGKLAVFAMREDRIDERRLRLDIRDAAAVRAFRETFAASVAADFAEARDASRVVLSAEDLAWDLHDGSEIERLRGLLARHGEVDRVLIYLRPQSELLISRHANAVKRGRTGDVSLLQAFAELRPYDYRTTLGRWAEVFGRQAMVVRLLEPDRFVGGSLHEDAADALGLPLEALPERPPMGNEGLDVQALAYLRLINKYLPTDEGGMSDAAHALVDTMRAIRTGPKSTAPGWKLSVWRKMFARGNAAVARDYFDRDVLFGESRSEGRAKLRVLTLDEAMEISARLWIAREQALRGDRRIDRRKAKADAAKEGVAFVPAAVRREAKQRPGAPFGRGAARIEEPPEVFKELLTDDAFETEAWVQGEGWSAADAVASHTPYEKSTAFKQALAKPLVPGARYRVSFRVVAAESGTVFFRLTRGTPVEGIPRDAAGAYTEDVVALHRHPIFAIIGSADFVGSVAAPSLMRLPSEDEAAEAPEIEAVGEGAAETAPAVPEEPSALADADAQR